MVATAGPDLESILAARGAGADEYSKEKHCRVLHFDIGGGTSNLALYENGALRDTDCLNIGGRLVKLTSDGSVTYLPGPGRMDGGPGSPAGGAGRTKGAEALISAMVDGLERAVPGDVRVLSFSGGGGRLHVGSAGGLAGLRRHRAPAGPAIRERFEEQGYTLVRGAETIRATVVGAGAHSMEVSGSTIFYREVAFPLKNLPVLPSEPGGGAGECSRPGGGRPQEAELVCR